LTGDEDWDLIREKITADDYEYDLDWYIEISK
jgi:hypothetical protein